MLRNYVVVRFINKTCTHSKCQPCQSKTLKHKFVIKKNKVVRNKYKNKI